LLQYYHTTTILGGLALTDPDATGPARPQSNSFSFSAGGGAASSDATSMMSGGALPGEVRCSTLGCDAVIKAGVSFCRGCGAKVDLTKLPVQASAQYVDLTPERSPLFGLGWAGRFPGAHVDVYM